MKLLRVILLSSILTSCIADPLSGTRQKAVDNECYSFLNFITNYYCNAYYSLPRDKESLLHFTERWRTKDSCFAMYEESYDMCFSDLMSLKVEFAYYTDSVFLYTETPYNKIGCCVYGHPFYWLEHPERYDPYRSDYYYQFRPSAYSKDGEYLFEEEFDYQQLSKQIDSLCSRYDIVVTHKGVYFDGFSERPHMMQVPFLAIVSVKSISDSLEIMTPILPVDSLFMYNKATGTYMPMNDSLMRCCRDYIEALKAIITENIGKNNDAERILLGIRWYCNES